MHHVANRYNMQHTAITEFKVFPVYIWVSFMLSIFLWRHRHDMIMSAITSITSIFYEIIVLKLPMQCQVPKWQFVRLRLPQLTPGELYAVHQQFVTINKEWNLHSSCKALFDVQRSHDVTQRSKPLPLSHSATQGEIIPEIKLLIELKIMVTLSGSRCHTRRLLLLSGIFISLSTVYYQITIRLHKLNNWLKFGIKKIKLLFFSS